MGASALRGRASALVQALFRDLASGSRESLVTVLSFPDLADPVVAYLLGGLAARRSAEGA
jgi:hypothetical protein